MATEEPTRNPEIYDSDEPDPNDLLSFQFPERPKVDYEGELPMSGGEEDEGEWFVLHLHDRPPRYTPDKPCLTPEQRKDECKKHSGMLVTNVCTEQYCSSMFCDKCRGDHNNHSGYSIAKVRQILMDNFARNAREIATKTELISQLEAMAKPFETALMKVADMIEGLVCDSELVKVHTSTIRRKCVCLVKSYGKMIGKCTAKICVLQKSNEQIKQVESGGNREVFKQFLRVRNMFARQKDEYEERTIEKITALIEELGRAQDVLKEDAEAIAIEFDELEERVLLAHLNSVDQELARMNRVLWECAGNTQVNVPVRRFVGGVKEYTLSVFDYKYKELSEIKVNNPYDTTEGSFAYALVGSSAYFTGGFNTSEHCALPFVFEIKVFESKRFERTEMLMRRSRHGMVAVMDKYLFVIGGKSHFPLASCEMYTIAQDKWRFAPSLPTTLISPATTVFDERYIYVFEPHTPSKAYKFDTCDMEGEWAELDINDPFKILPRMDRVYETCQPSPNFVGLICGSQHNMDSMVNLDVAKYTVHRREGRVNPYGTIQGKGVVIGGRLYFLSEGLVKCLDFFRMQCSDLPMVRTYTYSLKQKVTAINGWV